MNTTERRWRLIWLLIKIDHSIREATSLLSKVELDQAEKDLAEANLRFFRQTQERVEAMLSDGA